MMGLAISLAITLPFTPVLSVHAILSILLSVVRFVMVKVVFGRVTLNAVVITWGSSGGGGPKGEENKSLSLHCEFEDYNA